MNFQTKSTEEMGGGVIPNLNKFIGVLVHSEWTVCQTVSLVSNFGHRFGFLSMSKIHTFLKVQASITESPNIQNTISEYFLTKS